MVLRGPTAFFLLSTEIFRRVFSFIPPQSMILSSYRLL